MIFLKEYNKLYDSFDELTKESARKNRFIYIYSKAYLLIKQGPKIYHKNDFLKMPLNSWDSEITERVMNGCKQIIEGKGLIESNPRMDLDLDVDFFYRLFEVFYFKFISRKTKRIKLDRESHFLDIIDFVHFMDGGKITYHNLM